MRSTRFLSPYTNAALVLSLATLVAGCAIETSPGSSRGPESPPPAGPAGAATPHHWTSAGKRLKTV